jgi:hypothetical protein
MLLSIIATIVLLQTQAECKVKQRNNNRAQRSSTICRRRCYRSKLLQNVSVHSWFYHGIDTGSDCG